VNDIGEMTFEVIRASHIGPQSLVRGTELFLRVVGAIKALKQGGLCSDLGGSPRLPGGGWSGGSQKWNSDPQGGGAQVGL
jgi:hypothetical protein